MVLFAVHVWYTVVQYLFYFGFPQNPWRGVCRCLPPPNPPASVLVEPRINGKVLHFVLLPVSRF